VLFLPFNVLQNHFFHSTHNTSQYIPLALMSALSAIYSTHPLPCWARHIPSQFS